jgi:hypothetical protein
MSAHAEIVPSVVDRIKQSMVGLKMPRAIEILDATVRRLERGERSIRGPYSNYQGDYRSTGYMGTGSPSYWEYSFGPVLARRVGRTPAVGSWAIGT